MWSSGGLPSPALAEEHQEHQEREEQEERPSCSPVTQHSGEQSRRVRAPPEHRPPLAGAAMVMDRSLYLRNCGGDCLQTPRRGFGFRLKRLLYDLEVPSPFKSEEPTRQPRLLREALTGSRYHGDLRGAMVRIHCKTKRIYCSCWCGSG